MLARKRLEYRERQLRLTGNSMGRPENQARLRMPGHGLEYLARLLSGECGIPF